MPPKLVFGAGGIGAGIISDTWVDAGSTSSLLDTLKDLEISQLDSAGAYPPGNPWETERLLGESEAVKKGFVVDTKIAIIKAAGRDGSLSRKAIAESVEKSLKFLGVDKVHILYAHAPDPATPLEETAAGFDEQFRAGKFEKLGLSNYSTAQMAQYLSICAENNYVKPSVYQGEYNAISRHAETKLLPLLRENNIAYYAYSPLAGGFLTGKITFASAPATRGRYAPGVWPAAYDSVAAKPTLHDAIRSLHAVCQQHDLSTAEASLRWIMHHSQLGNEDAVILGASRVDQLKGNVEGCRKGPLSEEVRTAVERAWDIAVGVVDDET